MKAWLTATLVVALLGLGGCLRKDERASGFFASRGRYVGIGLYTPGRMWTQLKLPASGAANPEAATLGDDETILVVMDSATGEMRQCGNLSGHCTGFNPWSTAASGAPAALLKHAQQLDEEARAAQAEVEAKARAEAKAEAKTNAAKR